MRTNQYKSNRPDKILKGKNFTGHLNRYTLKNLIAKSGQDARICLGVRSPVSEVEIRLLIQL